MALRPVLLVGDHLAVTAAPQVGSHSLIFVEDLHCGGCGAHLDRLMDQVVGHTVKVGIESDVIIDVHLGA
jgi:hypothetical protein